MEDVEINLSKIDWNNLTINEFHELSEKISNRNKIKKEKSERKSRIHSLGKTPVMIRGIHYELPNTLIERLVLLKSGKSKEKLIEEIISQYAPIPSI